MHYAVNMALRDFEVAMYLNDQNLITNPHSREANSELTLRNLSKFLAKRPL